MIQPVTDLSIFVRPATADDAAILLTHRELSGQEATQYRGSVLQPSFNESHGFTFVAGVGSTVMGSLVSTPSETNIWSIDFVFVDATCREIGIGDALVIACLRELTQRNATWVQSSAMPGDRAMKNLFERHGLVAQTIIVGKKL
jgi:ribosomal protein S18 acetylase RimI-like enzyme